MRKIIAYDLGTGGIKASLFDENGVSLAESFIQYETYFPHDKWCEQRPEDWWDGVCKSTKALLEKNKCDPREIAAAALSGHSLVVAPIGRDGRLLLDQVPIWCDMRSGDMHEAFFANVPYEKWYMTTGNGDPPECYSVLKLMWMKEHQRDIFDQTDVVLGSKDYINYKLTGTQCTDPSYASGFGVFNLEKWDYEQAFIDAAGLPRSIFPDIVPSDAIVGTVSKEAASQTGLVEGIPIACGGVDNTCMALGARGIGEGKIYTSLGSSSWIAVSAKKPILDLETLPFVFAHAQKGYYTSAVSIFSAGNSFRWVRDTLLKDVLPEEARYDRMNEMAATVPPGSNGLLFNPTLAGGSSQEDSPHTHGSFAGLSLGTTREDMVRASMEGIAMALRCVLDILRKYVATQGQEMLICGGGSKSRLWRQMFADIYNMDVLKTNVDQDAASLGAAALAANACGIWKGYDMIEGFHKTEDISHPISENNAKYEKLLEAYRMWSGALSQLGDKMQQLHQEKVW
ncbi:MAG: FGGY-family carbohydrate kinase [Christensenella sp.]|uniref:xylulokinase n=1 Tax=Christensenella sp. TaxID=1935934 RepID=UPI002B219FCB|nr:FGGY-family carbohydrate kinase [Christensenella sp.]MEA5003033.1 FGGY-family carbohydrate kinase [Christensenella sp.]